MGTSVFLMSFRAYWDLVGHTKEFFHEAWSAAMYQPHWYPGKLRQLGIFLIQEQPGWDWIRPRMFAHYKEPLVEYGHELYQLYKLRKDRIERWVDHVQGKSVALCCWCPYDKAAQRQLKEHGSFVCHLGVVAWFLTNEFKVDCQFLDKEQQRVRFPYENPSHR